MSEKVEKQVDLNSLTSTFLRERSVAYAPPISRRLIGAVRREMVKGVKAGERIGDMVGRVRKILDDQAPFRALKIVRTEVVGAFNRGNLEGFRQAPEVVKQKEWLTARDGNVRPTQPGDFNHQASDTQRRNVEDPFSVSGESLMHPGDPGGSPGNIINCRCTMLPVTARQIAVPEPAPPPVGPVAPPAPVRPVRPRRPRRRVPTPVPRPAPAPAPPPAPPVAPPAPTTVAPTADTRPRRPRKPRAPKTEIPRKLTDPEITTFITGAAKGDVEAERLFGRALRDKNFRNKVATDKILEGTKIIETRQLPSPTLGQFDALDSSAQMSNALTAIQEAEVTAHEIFHGTTHARGWFGRSKQAAFPINLNNPEAARLFELYKNTIARTETVLAARAADTTLGKASRKKYKRWVENLRVQQAKTKFGQNYRKGVVNWEEMREAKVLTPEEMGIPRAYSLHSPHEYATTSFEDFVFFPSRLKRRDPDMFNFFESFYKEGVFKRVVGELRKRRRQKRWQS